MFLGATGTGKTTFEATASGFLQRFDPLMFVVDYNRSTELFVRASGGSYFALQEGIYTGCDPWQLAEGPESPVWHRLLAFLNAGHRFWHETTRATPVLMNMALN